MSKRLVNFWDRGRPARPPSHEHTYEAHLSSFRASRSFAGGTPAVPDKRALISSNEAL